MKKVWAGTFIIAVCLVGLIYLLMFALQAKTRGPLVPSGAGPVQTQPNIP